MLIAGLGVAVLILSAFLAGYAIGHYEALRCSCTPRTQHFLRRWLGLGLTERESDAIAHEASAGG